MTSSVDVWRRNLWLWLFPVGFCLINMIALMTYHLRFAGDVEGLEDRYRARMSQLETYRTENLQVANFLSRATDQQEKFDLLYEEHFQKEGERFTRAITEVKRLAREAGLDPTSFSYPREYLGTTGLLSRKILFAAEGSYRQLRTFINFLELSDQFLTLESITLSESASSGREPVLRINLRVSTIFVGSIPSVENAET
jgi:Tfp pilus assembly protein PilO